MTTESKTIFNAHNIFAIVNGLLPEPGMVEVAARTFRLVTKVRGVGAHQNDAMNFVFLGESYCSTSTTAVPND